jgi:phage-related protein
LYEVIYYSENNKIPVLDFLKQLNPKDQAKILREIDLLTEFGFSLGMPHIKKMSGTKDLWELRIKQSSNNFRIFYFYYKNNKFILLHGFLKKSQKTPIQEISIALKRRTKFIEGCENNES